MAYDWKNDWLNGRIAEAHLAHIYKKMGMNVTNWDGKEFDLMLNNDIKIEIKYDILSQETGNFFIESFDDKDSGIRTTEADIWVQYNGRYFFFTKVDTLRGLVDGKYFPTSKKKSPETGRMVVGYIIPIPDFLSITYKKIKLTKDWVV